MSKLWSSSEICRLELGSTWGKLFWKHSSSQSLRLIIFFSAYGSRHSFCGLHILVPCFLWGSSTESVLIGKLRGCVCVCEGLQRGSVYICGRAVDLMAHMLVCLLRDCVVTVRTQHPWPEHFVLGVHVCHFPCACVNADTHRHTHTHARSQTFWSRSYRTRGGIVSGGGVGWGGGTHTHMLP